MAARHESILIVDDENVLRKSLRKKLSREDYHCDEAGSADEALEILESNPADLIILDIRMPGKSGLELLPEIKDKYPDVAVIMVTAINETGTAVECMKRGAADYVIKPFDLNDVLSAVDRALQKRDLELKIKNHQRSLEQKIRAELSSRNEQKTEFLHAVAHEIRTPLTAIIASSELLDEAMSSTDIDQRLRMVSNITRGARLIDDKVSELIDYSRMRAGELGLQVQPVEIDLLVREMASRFLPLFAGRSQSLQLDIESSLPQLEADRDKLEEILFNLLSNANRFSASGGSITLRVRNSDNGVIIEVEDSAQIITEAEREKVFDPYYRIAGAGKGGQIPGLGLGLTITKKLVELHGGEMWVDSKPGEGNIFAFSLLTSAKQVKTFG